MKKKYRLKNKTRFVFIIMVLLVMVLCASTVAATAGNIKKEYRVVSVRPGDTLWGIASVYSGDTDIREYIYNIKKLNQMKSATIYAGQTLYLP